MSALCRFSVFTDSFLYLGHNRVRSIYLFEPWNQEPLYFSPLWKTSGTIQLALSSERAKDGQAISLCEGSKRVCMCPQIQKGISEKKRKRSNTSDQQQIDSKSPGWRQVTEQMCLTINCTSRNRFSPNSRNWNYDRPIISSVSHDPLEALFQHHDCGRHHLSLIDSITPHYSHGWPKQMYVMRLEGLKVIHANNWATALVLDPALQKYYGIVHPVRSAHASPSVVDLSRAGQLTIRFIS